MKIAIVTPYDDVYSRDRLFDPSSCKIGQNLLLPGIILKKELEKLGHVYHTADMYNTLEEVDVWVFQDLNNSSKLTIRSPKELISYLLKKKWKNDYFYKCQKLKNKNKSVLIMQEPEVVFPQSYNWNNHKYFDRVLTWDTGIIDNKKYFQFYYPQVKPDNVRFIPYNQKKKLTMICGNKNSSDRNELYSERKKVIDYYENNNQGFDLYGFGWETDGLKNYCGVVDDKLATLTKYKFSICFENMKSKSGYITEKLFDSFFSGCIPIYYGAEDISRYVPNNTFIDYRNFNSISELDCFLNKMKKDEYEQIQRKILEYLVSDSFKSLFSIEAYVNRMIDAITNWD